MPKRERLGMRRAFSHREYVYRSRDCFEIDEIEGYEVTRKRVFFDDVVLVTRHFFRAWAPAILAGLFAGLFGLTALGLATSAGAARAVGFAFFVVALLNLLLAILLLTIGGEVVTIQGKRTIARMHFVLRRSRAVEVYRLACRLARERQQQLARQIAARERAASSPSSGPPAPPSAPVAPPTVSASSPDATVPALPKPPTRPGPRSD